jgi:hypothetical protein
MPRPTVGFAEPRTRSHGSGRAFLRPATVGLISGQQVRAVKTRFRVHFGEMANPKCPKCGVELVAKPVPGAKHFPQRLECPEHGWQQEKLRPIRMRFHKDRPNW